jgi:predicted RNase H-like HicB family nuclease
MKITLLIHLEPAETGKPVWWAESDELPGFTASADSLVELRSVVAEVLTDIGPEAEDGIIEIASERLIGARLTQTASDVPTVQTEDHQVVESRSPVQVLVA